MTYTFTDLDGEEFVAVPLDALPVDHRNVAHKLVVKLLDLAKYVKERAEAIDPDPTQVYSNGERQNEWHFNALCGHLGRLNDIIREAEAK